MKALKLLAAVIAVSMVATVSYAAGAKKGSQKMVSELEWKELAPGIPLQISVLWGVREKGAHGMLLKMPAGFNSGMHAHTSEYHGVVVQGTWMHSEEGQTEVKELGPGSYAFQPGKGMHNDACKEGSECIVMIYSPGKADFIPQKK